MSWLLSNNRLEEVCGTLTKGIFSSRLLLSNQDKGCTPSVAHSLPLPLPPGFCSTCQLYARARGQQKYTNTQTQRLQNCIDVIANLKSLGLFVFSSIVLQQGVLIGPSIAIVYTVVGIPIARFTDNNSRVIPLALGLLVWTGMVCLTAFAETYWMLLLAQMVIGIGEVSWINYL